ncbi:hypothetical protein WJX73_007346 [Symbiochloris irregularis]|uniref:Uncharacterized protein n=1 Tax=Symbiochloris irregularis TaxID=706552 RepID=A0AAW1NYJ7_9CHLO
MAAQSPHDQRELLRTRQRSVRLALNTYHSLSTEWKDKSAEGRQAAGAAADSLLQLRCDAACRSLLVAGVSVDPDRYLPHRPLGALEPIDGLQVTAATKLRCQLWDSVRQTVAISKDLLDTAQRVRQVINIYFDSSEESSTQAVALPERPVFATIPWSRIAQWMHDLAESYGKEARAKKAIAEALTQMAGQYCPILLSAAHEPDPLKDTDDEVRTRLEIYLTSWSLESDLDEPTICSHISDITEDMRTF